MKCILNAGVNLVADRYVGSNMGHQGSKIADPEERAKFFAWNDDLEHGIFGLPRPDVNVVLHVPSKVAIELMSERASKHGLARDIHEADPRHLEQAEAAYLDLASRFETFRVVECVEEGRLLGPEEIHEKIWILVKPFLTA
jgi:dTMP kinase